MKDGKLKRPLVLDLRRKVGHVMLVADSIVLGLVLILVGVPLAVTPGRVKPLLDGSARRLAGGIAEKVFVEINGTRQGMFIQSRDPAMYPLGIGTMHDTRSHITGVFLRSFATLGYTLGERVNLWRPKAWSGVSPLSSWCTNCRQL